MQKVAGFVVFSALKSSFQISEKAAIEVVCESSPCILSVVMKSTQHVKTKLIPLNSEGNFSFCILAWIGLMLMVNKGSIIKGWLQFVQIWCGTLGKKQKTKHKTNKQKKSKQNCMKKKKRDSLENFLPYKSSNSKVWPMILNTCRFWQDNRIVLLPSHQLNTNCHLQTI